jgi:hypothetical protein
MGNKFNHVTIMLVYTLLYYLTTQKAHFELFSHRWTSVSYNTTKYLCRLTDNKLSTRSLHK